MVFQKARQKEIYGWELAIERCIRQVFEVYSGGPVRIECLNIRPIRGYDRALYEQEAVLRDAEVTGKVVGRQLEHGEPHEFVLEVGLGKRGPGSHWVPYWNKFDLQLRKPHAAHWTRYFAAFDDAPVTRGEQVVPTVRVHRIWADEYGENATLRDTEYRIGSHLGDRRLEPIPETSRYTGWRS